MLWLLIAALFGVVFYLVKSFLNRDFNRASKQFEGPLCLPFIGNAYSFIGLDSKGIWDKILSISQNYDRYFRVWTQGQFNIICKDHREMEVFLGSNVQLDKGNVYRFILPWIGYGLLTSTGAKWRAHRKIITPTFHFKILEQFLEVFNRNGEVMCERMEAEMEQGPFDVYPYVNLAALDNIYETAMGVNMGIQKNSNTKYVRAVKNICGVINTRAFKVFLWSDLFLRLTKYHTIQQDALKVLHSTTEEIIQQRRRELSVKERVEEKEDEGFYQKKRLAFLDLLLESGASLSDQDLRDEVETFMFEGHDTITSGLSFTLRALADNPHVQEKVYQEQVEIFGNSDRVPSYCDIQSMKYLERVIKESQRLFPSVPVIVRELTEEAILQGGLTVPKKTQVTLMIYELHRDPKIWPDPEKFDPERFTPDAVQSRHPYAYVPFSAGPRNCIGQKFAMLEMKASVSKAVRKFRFLPCLEEKYRMQLLSELVLISLNGVFVQIQRRK